MTPQLLHAEVDTFQVAIIVLAVIFSFLKWLWEQWTGNKLLTPEEAEEPDPTEELRRRLQEEQARHRAAAAPQPPPVPAAPLEELRKTWREVREAAQAQKQQPPPIRTAQRQPPPVQKVAEAFQKPAPAPPVTPVTAPAVVQTTSPNTMLTSLRSLRDDPAAMRRAIVLGEVLGPPKALQG